MSASRSQPSAENTSVEPAAAFTPGRHLQAIHHAFFNGGGWLDPLSWGDYDPEGHAKWEEFARSIGENIDAAVTASGLLKALHGALARIDDANASCPVRSSPKSVEKCPRCGATGRQNCGPNAAALDALKVAARAAMALGVSPASPAERTDLARDEPPPKPIPPRAG